MSVDIWAFIEEDLKKQYQDYNLEFDGLPKGSVDLGETKDGNLQYLLSIDGREITEVLIDSILNLNTTSLEKDKISAFLLQNKGRHIRFTCL